MDRGKQDSRTRNTISWRQNQKLSPVDIPGLCAYWWSLHISVSLRGKQGPQSDSADVQDGYKPYSRQVHLLPWLLQAASGWENQMIYREWSKWKNKPSVPGAGWGSGKRSSPASQDDGDTNRASGFAKWLHVTIGMKWKPLISIITGKSRTAVWTRQVHGENLFSHRCLDFSAEGLKLKATRASSPVLQQSQD